MRALVGVRSEWLLAELRAARARDERPLCNQPIDERERTQRAKKRDEEDETHTMRRWQWRAFVAAVSASQLALLWR
jgi:hypothetical protein